LEPFGPVQACNGIALPYSLLLDVESNPLAYSGRKDDVNEKISTPVGNQTRDLPACSVVSQPNGPPRAPE